jgi:predicted transcriptional regulator
MLLAGGHATMARNCDALDRRLEKQIKRSPGIRFSQLLELMNVPASTLRYRLMTLELDGVIVAKRSRNSNSYYLLGDWRRG